MPQFHGLVDIENVFGKTNVAKWSDVDNDQNIITVGARQTAAMDKSEAYILSRLDTKGYGITFEFPVNTLIVDMLAQRSGWNLYYPRGVVDADPNNNAMKTTLEQIELTLGQIISGVIKIVGLERSNDAPFVEEFPSTDDLLHNHNPQHMTCARFFDT